MHKLVGPADVQDAVRERLKIRSGYHMVMAANGLMPGQVTERIGEMYSSLTKARKAAQRGDAIVRLSDKVVVSVK